MNKYFKLLFKSKGMAVIAVFMSGLFVFSGSASKVVENVDYIYMHIGLQVDYPLPEKFKEEKLRFEGNYKRYTSAVYRKASNDIRFKPLRPGSAVMIIKNQKKKIIGRLHIDVQKDNLHKIAAELRDLLIAIDGIQIKIYNKKVIIDGQVLLPSEMDRIKRVVAEYTPLVKSFVGYSPEAQKKIAEVIEREIGEPEVTVRYAHNRFLLEGCVNSNQDLKRALKIANLYTQFDVSSVGKGANRRGIHVVNSELNIPCETTKKEEEDKEKKKQIKKLIQFVVHFVEMNKSFSKNFLFQWTPAIGDNGTQVTGSVGNNPGISRGITAVLSATVANFFPKLNWAKSFSFARVLHNSSILVKEGGHGTINTQVETPSTTLENGTQISGGVNTQVSTGFKDIEIIGERADLVHMTVTINVSSPTGGGVASRNIQTSLHVRDGSSAAIGGLISSHLSRGYNNKDPQAVASPIVNLYSAKSYNTTKSQFIVFITPLIKSHSHLGVDRIKKKFKLDE